MALQWGESHSSHIHVLSPARVCLTVCVRMRALALGPELLFRHLPGRPCAASTWSKLL